ncbi:DMT family transporter [Microbulbifer hainanensis]|uniref:DMT family transporter n=1 Tax=Microbulbifer hainanensis TaxID=2735675 RepID=UPI001D01D853|nr:DMT family transporter [Microbulbifer hainanensis]
MMRETHGKWWQSGLVLVAAATFAIAFKGIFARLIYQYGVPVDTVLIWRFFLAVPLFWIVARWLTRGQPPVRLSPRQWFLCALTGALFFVSAWCDFHAIAALGASVSRMVLYLFPALLMVIQAAEQRRLPGAAQLAVFAVAWTGIALLLLPGWHGGTLSLAGLLYGFGAATCYAVFWRISQSLTVPLGSVRFNQFSNSFTLLFMAAFLLPNTPATELAVSAPAFAWILVLVVFSTVLPFFLLFEGLRRADAAEAGVVAMFGPVVTISAAMLVFPDERLGPLQWLGAALILASIGALKLVKSRRSETAGLSPSN